MTSGTLYTHPHSPRSNWLSILVEHLKLDVKVVPFDQVENFKELFPLGKVPAYVGNDGYKLTEFLAIVEYLLTISDNKTYIGENLKDKMQVLRWLSFINQDMVGVWGKYFFASPTDELKKANSDAQTAQFSYLENELSSRSYIAGDYITIADIYLLAWYSFFAKVVGGETNVEFPALTKWYELVKETDPVAKKIASK